ncbi:BA75_03472T0 [Komagataella pastoris]|uniref:BA75_03472T0 n=1 Tax=Komagataella pastoris TaxID=4922 RepID=A0A1B2JGE3_PICPA|nr:BA75_03472T0 [Komagataella pastoris]
MSDKTPPRTPRTPPAQRGLGVQHSETLNQPENIGGKSLLSPSSRFIRRRSSIDFINNSMTVPKTPDLRSGTDQFEGTPLKSPSFSPTKRRSTDFYQLLRTPERPGQSTQQSSGDGQGLGVREDEFLFHDHFKSPKKTSHRVSKKKDELKEISSNLRTRLNYAFHKVQQNDLDTFRDFYKSNSQSLPTPLSSAVSTSTGSLRPLPKSQSHPDKSKKPSLNEIASNKLRANSASGETPQRRPLAVHPQSEQDAIMSLMSLASPVKKSSSSSYYYENAITDVEDNDDQEDEKVDTTPINIANIRSSFGGRISRNTENTDDATDEEELEAS